MTMLSSSSSSSPPLPPLLKPVASFESFHSLVLDRELDNRDSVVTEEGLPHSDVALKARKYKERSFVSNVVRIILELDIPLWNTYPTIDFADVRIHKVAGSLTNSVFFVSHHALPTLLLRVYGASSDALISRPHELHTLHILSSKYHFGPRVFGTFQNGRIEEYFESTTLSAADIRVPYISELIAIRMAELHRVDISAVEGEEWDLGIRKNIRSWVTPARQVLQLVDGPFEKAFDIDGFVKTWENYWNWVRHWEEEYGQSPRVFAHNDAQYGNLLRLSQSPLQPQNKHQIIVVDFEYASPNPAAFDIANHFHEWTVDYHSDKPWFLDPLKYPSHSERETFYKAYLSAFNIVPTTQQLVNLDLQVRVWSPASHAMWAIWGLVQAKEELETREAGEFDYLKYAQCRLNGFRREIRSLGL